MKNMMNNNAWHKQSMTTIMKMNHRDIMLMSVYLVTTATILVMMLVNDNVNGDDNENKSQAHHVGVGLPDDKC